MTQAWDRVAASRDAASGDSGDLWHRALIDPSVRRLVGSVRGLRVLEVACGNGYLSRAFAREGATEVLGIDRSPASIRLARARERRHRSGARFEVGDAGKLRFPDGSFDRVVANMALMDIEPAGRAVREMARVMAPGGRLVFSLCHPCFDQDERSAWSVEAGYDAFGVFRQTVYRRVSAYRDERRVRVPWTMSDGSVVRTVSFHRTLTTYSRYLRDAGLAIAELDEPSPEPEMLRSSSQGAYLKEIPLHLIVAAVRRPGPTPGSRTRARSRGGGSRRSGSRGRTGGSGSSSPGSSPGS